jgi:hypothetical protein
MQRINILLIEFIPLIYALFKDTVIISDTSQLNAAIIDGLLCSATKFGYGKYVRLTETAELHSN